MAQEPKRESSNKKRYTAPRLVSHGDVDELTQQGGNQTDDMPIGTADLVDITS